jgi:uncharacterized protein
MAEYFLIGIIAFIVSLISGMLGLGGAIMLIPAYLYLPSLFGLDGLGIKNISGMTSVQVFATSLFGMLLHRKKKAFNQPVVLTVGIPIVISSFAGAYLSGWVNPNLIVSIFAVMATTGAALIIFAQKTESADSEKSIDFNKFSAVIIGILVGFFGGIAGAPGAFLLSPLLMIVLKIPTRVTIGSTLGIVLLASFATSLGKISSGIVPFDLTAAAILFSIPGVFIGSNLSHKFTVSTLRWGIAVIIALMGLDIWFQILFQ